MAPASTHQYARVFMTKISTFRKIFSNNGVALKYHWLYRTGAETSACVILSVGELKNWGMLDRGLVSPHSLVKPFKVDQHPPYVCMYLDMLFFPQDGFYGLWVVKHQSYYDLKFLHTVHIS